MLSATSSEGFLVALYYIISCGSSDDEDAAGADVVRVHDCILPETSDKLRLLMPSVLADDCS